MGPRHRCRGNADDAVSRRATVAMASMGPRHRCRGIARCVHRRSQYAFGFNGAAASMPRNCVSRCRASARVVSLQWGRGIDAAELVALGDGDHDRCALQWGRGIDAAEYVVMQCVGSWCRRFNGAAASMPRKCSVYSCTVSVTGKASMGPRHRCRGICSCTTPIANTAKLQWGRGIDAAECALPAAEGEEVRSFNGAAASMPRK